MIKIYSKIKKNKLLHIVITKEDLKPGRINLIADDNYLHCALLNLKKGTTFKPHKHRYRLRLWKVIAQESWHVLCGKVKCTFYDIDDSILDEIILNEGDSSFTLFGGHNYLILEDNTKVLEYKTGKYEGQKIDKIFI